MKGFAGSSGYEEIGSIGFISPGGSQDISTEIMPSHRIAGNEFSGTYKVPIFLNETHESGKWSVEYINLYDDAGNYFHIGINDGWNTSLTDASISQLAKRLSTESNSISFSYLNTSDNLPDITAPILDDLSIESNDDDLIVKLKISDSQAGVGIDVNESLYSSGGYDSFGSLSFTSSSGNQYVNVDVHNYHRVDGDEFMGTYHVPLKLAKYHEPGTWTLAGVNINDQADNYFSVYRNSSWDSPTTDADRIHMATRLGVDSNAITLFTRIVILNRLIPPLQS